MIRCSFNGTFCETLATFKAGKVDILVLATMLPSLLFMIYLLFKLKLSVKIIKKTESLILPVYYTYSWAVCVFICFGCAVWLIFSSITDSFIPPMVIFTIITFVVTFTELSVVVFMFHHDTTQSNSVVLIRTFVISWIISCIDNVVGVCIIDYC